MRVGKDIVLITRPDDLCLGVVGKNTTRICLGKKTCAVSAHQEHKFFNQRIASNIGSTSYILILGPARRGDLTAFCDPCLAADELDDDLKNHLLELSSDDTDIAALFGLIAGSNIQTLAQLESTQSRLKTVRKPLKDSQTPAKLDARVKITGVLNDLGRVKDSVGDILSGLLNSIDQLSEMSQDDPALPKVSSEILKQQSIALEQLNLTLKNVMAAVSIHSDLRSEEYVDIQGILEGLKAMVDELRGSLGKRKAASAGLSDPSLWGYAHSLSETVGNLEKGFGILTDRISDLAASVITLNEKVASIPNTGSDGDVHMNEVNDNGPTIQNGFLRAMSGRAGNPTGSSSSSSSDGGQRVSFEDDSLSLLSSKVGDLETRLSVVEGLQGGKTSDSVSFGQHTFHSLGDVDAFLDKHLGIGSTIHFSCFTSPGALLDLIFRLLHGSRMKNAKDLKDIKSLGLRQQEVDAYASADTDQVCPELLGSSERLKNHTYKTRPSANVNPRFPAIPSAEDFGLVGDTTSLCQAILDKLATVQEQRQSDINKKLLLSPVLQVLATQMLSKSVKFIQDLLSFMGQTFLTLKASFHQDAGSWDCVCKSVEDLWSSQFLPEKKDMASADISEPRLLAVLVIWTNMKLVNVADQLSSTKIAAHPSVTSSYIRFLIGHFNSRNNDALSPVLAKILSIENDYRKVCDDLTSVRGKLTSLESRHDKLQGEFKKLKKQQQE